VIVFSLESEAHMTEEAVAATTEMTQPVIIDLGKQKAKAVKALKEGEGDLWTEVLEVVEEVRDMLGNEAEGKVLVPVVIVYRRKPKRRRLNVNRLLFPLNS
jgi:hypothetical protein